MRLANVVKNIGRTGQLEELSLYMGIIIEKNLPVYLELIKY